MVDLWTSLLPLIVASALVPIQIVVTTLLLRSKAGRATALAWVAGMTSTRLAQGILFGLLLGAAEEGAGSSDEEHDLAIAILLLIVAIVFYVGAARKARKEPDEDRPPPRWMAALADITPAKAYLGGLGLVAVSVKFWVFTLGVIAAIDEAQLGTQASVLTYLVYAVSAASVSLAIIAVAYAAPDRAARLLDRIALTMERHDRAIVIAVGVVFGTWFLLKALAGLGLV